MATDIATLGLKVDSRGVVSATKDLERLEREGGQAEKAAGKLSKSFSGLSSAAKVLGGAIATIGLVRLISNVKDAALAMEAIDSSLRVATGSAEGAKTEFEFLRKESERLGLDIRSSADAFASLSAAAKGTSLEGQGARDIFVAISESMTALGRDSLSTERALRAIEQMISKGTVSAEELRGQLGEVLPGAFQAAARAAGVTTQELGKMLQKGEVLAEDLLPKLAVELGNTFSAEAERRANGLQAETNRFKTAVFELMAGSNMTDMTSSIRTITEVIKDPNFQTGFSSFVGGVITLGSWAAQAAAGTSSLATSIGEMAAKAQGFLTLEDQIERKLARIAQLNDVFARMGNVNNVVDMIAQANDELAALKSISGFDPFAKATDSPAGKLNIGDGGAGESDNGLKDSTDLLLNYNEQALVYAERQRDISENYDMVTTSLSEQLTMIGMTERAAFQYQAQMRLSAGATDERRSSVETLAGRLYDEQKAFDELNKKTSESEDNFKTLTSAVEGWGSSFADAMVESTGSLDSFAENMIKQLQKIALQKASQPVFDAFSSFVGGGLKDLFSFDGGGFTGSGARSGGVDGKGGFPAILHPNETVTDHTKGQSTGGGNISISVQVDASGSQTGGDQQGANLGKMIGSAVRSVLIQERRPGGLLT